MLSLTFPKYVMIVEKIYMGDTYVTCPYFKLGFSNYFVYRNLFKLFKVQGATPYF